MSLETLLTDLRRNAALMANVVAWRLLPAQAAQFSALPNLLQPRLRTAALQRGIEALYTHQAEALENAWAGRNYVVATPTASGKTLCYNLPVFDALLSDEQARALYLFPTKALAHDQLDEIGAWGRAWSGAPGSLLAAAYDGDTPTQQRSRIRKLARIILTNPDMLHAGILPFHPQWAEFFGGLRYVVIDEVHTYRGVFGSHVANVLRRLQRICTFYDSQPRFICTSATIANPDELCERLIEQPCDVIAESGAARGEKHILLYNPPMIDAEQGLRRSAVLEAQDLAGRSILAGVQTIVFARARQTAELLLTYLQERLRRSPQQVRGYRSGYLPSERRAIEAGLRSGEVAGVVATNALELGIDIGDLQTAILCGYPGSIASAWQQMGRAGRSQAASLAILVATALPLDQYLMRHPEFLLERSPEQALIQPDNLMLLVDQVRCAAFELPFRQGERFGNAVDLGDVLQLLAEQGSVRCHGGRWLWSGAGYPAHQVSLRNSDGQEVSIQAQRPGDQYGEPSTTVSVIGQADHASAPMLVHAGAVYLHGGESYLVERLDLAKHLAWVKPAVVDFYTQAETETEVEALAVHEQKANASAVITYGDLRVTAQVIGYRRIKRQTHETLGVFALDYPPQMLETSGYWFGVCHEVQVRLVQQGAWFDSLNDYGPDWSERRREVRQRDGYRCTQCGMPETAGREHDVHHLCPFRTFGYLPGLNENYRQANQLSNLILVCRTCHRRLESGVRTRGALDGLGYALANIAPLHLMCDRNDLGVYIARAEFAAGLSRRESISNSVQPPFGELPAICLYEQIAAGLGFSLRLYELHDQLMLAAHQLIADCPCHNGCPACVGPVFDNPLAQLDTKRLTLALAEALSEGAAGL